MRAFHGFFFFLGFGWKEEEGFTRYAKVLDLAKFGKNFTTLNERKRSFSIVYQTATKLRILFCVGGWFGENEF